MKFGGIIRGVFGRLPNNNVTIKSFREISVSHYFEVDYETFGRSPRSLWIKFYPQTDHLTIFGNQMSANLSSAVSCVNPMSSFNIAFDVFAKTDDIKFLHLSETFFGTDATFKDKLKRFGEIAPSTDQAHLESTMKLGIQAKNTLTNNVHVSQDKRHEESTNSVSSLK